MIIRQFLTGGDRNFAYLAADEGTGKAMVVDPSYSPSMVYDFAGTNGLTIEYVFNTHRHADHSNGNAEMRRLTGRTALAYGDIETVTDIPVEDGAKFPLGSLEIVVLHTPGHTPDSICLLVGDALFTGDTLFVGKVGGTDYGEGARREYESLHRKLMTLPDATRVFPGHDVGVEPESTIGNEKKSNPFILQENLEAFVHLKRTWLEYKHKHGIA